MDVSAPVAAHEKLRPFVGKFKAMVKLWFGPGDPMISTGSMTNTMDLGGRFLHQFYEGDASDGPFPEFAGRGYWGYNTALKKYQAFWIDTASTMMHFETGDVDSDGHIWTMCRGLTHPQTGEPMRKRSVISLHDDDHHTMEMFDVGTGSKEMEIQYERTR